MTQRRAIERELRRAARLTALVREELPTVLGALTACGERVLAAGIASIMGTTEHAELGADGVAAAREAAADGEPARAAAGFRELIRLKLAEEGIPSRADLAAWVATLGKGKP